MLSFCVGCFIGYVVGKSCAYDAARKSGFFTFLGSKFKVRQITNKQDIDF